MLLIALGALIFCIGRRYRRALQIAPAPIPMQDLSRPPVPGILIFYSFLFFGTKDLFCI